MRTIDIKDVDVEEMFLHFTSSKNIDSISEMGLLPSIGENAFGVERNPKIFFSKGFDGSAEILNVWIKWLIYKKQRKIYFKDANSPEAYDEACKVFAKDLKDGTLFEGEIKEEVFEYFYNFLSNSNYLVLDLDEGVDYIKDDIDEVKFYCKGGKDNLEVLYGKFTSNVGMEKWNMHTKVGVSVPPDRLKVLSVYGKTDGLSIARELFDLCDRKNDTDLGLLNEFMDFSNQKKSNDYSSEVKKDY